MLGNLRIRAVAAAFALCGLLLMVRGDILGAREPLQPAGPLISSAETIVGETIVYPTGA